MKKHLRPKSNRRRLRRHGFLHRMRTRGGRHTISRRRRKGRRQLAPVA